MDAHELVSKQMGGRCDCLKGELILDTGLTVATNIANPNLVTNARVSKEPLIIATNAGAKKIGPRSGH